LEAVNDYDERILSSVSDAGKKGNDRIYFRNCQSKKAKFNMKRPLQGTEKASLNVDSMMTRTVKTNQRLFHSRSFTQNMLISTNWLKE